MNKNYLGDGPRYDDDPFMGLHLSEEHDCLSDFYNDDDHVVEEEPPREIDAFDAFCTDDTSPSTLPDESPSDGFAMDPIYDMFRCDLFPDLYVPDPEGPDVLVETSDAMASTETTTTVDYESPLEKVDIAPEPTTTASLAPVPMPMGTEFSRPLDDVVPAAREAPITEEIAKAPMKPPKAPAFVRKKAAAAAARNRAAATTYQRPITSRPPKRTLYPVKISKVLPQAPRHGAIANSPYAISPVPPKRPVPFDPENSPETGQQNPDGTPAPGDGTERKSLKPSSVIPRDHSSNHQRCSQCQSAFTSQLALEFHEVEKHAHVYAYECRMCKKIYADIREVNKHIKADHNKATVPLLDSSIFGNGDISENGKKGSQRRITGMIECFLRKIRSSGMVGNGNFGNKGVVDVVNGNETEVANESVLDTSQVEETATINDLLKREYIYGHNIQRILLKSVPPSEVIRRRYYELPPDHKHIPNFLRDNPPQRKVTQQPTPVILSNSQAYQDSSYAAPIRQQVVYTTSYVQQSMPIASSSQYVTSYMPRTHRAVYVLPEKSGFLRAAPATNPDNRIKMSNVEMPPQLEHFAAGDYDGAPSQPAPYQFL